MLRGSQGSGPRIPILRERQDGGGGAGDGDEFAGICRLGDRDHGIDDVEREFSRGPVGAVLTDRPGEFEHPGAAGRGRDRGGQDLRALGSAPVDDEFSIEVVRVGEDQRALCP